MIVAAGKSVYNIGRSPCSGAGVCWSKDDLDSAIDGPVAAVLFDDMGKADIRKILADLAHTKFAQKNLQRILADPVDISSWRVGEAIAESYLTCHRSCHFPWPDGRDERKAGSSLPGADLVGFGSDCRGDCFAFGEVKTSGEERYPPKTVYGRAGLKQQLEDLRDSEVIRHALMKYLGHRAGGAPWRSRYKNAARRYLKNNSDVQIYGFLVRDVEPHRDDLEARVTLLAANCPEGTQIMLFALYLPQGVIKSLGESIISRRSAGGEL